MSKFPRCEAVGRVRIGLYGRDSRLVPTESPIKSFSYDDTEEIYHRRANPQAYPGRRPDHNLDRNGTMPPRRHWCQPAL